MDNMDRTPTESSKPAGEIIQLVDGKLVVPDRPIIPFIEGDGIGPEIWTATRRVIDKAIELAYGGKRGIVWEEIYAAEKAMALVKEPLPKATLDAIAKYRVAIKGPLGTPTGGGMRSLNVALRKHFDLYECLRPVRYFTGVPSPMRNPHKVNVDIFRENSEDIYTGIEFESNTAIANLFIETLRNMGFDIRDESGLGIKPISPFASKRIVRKAMQHAIAHGRKVVTFVGKGNIQKYTEGAFVAWAFEVAKTEFRDYVVTEEELEKVYNWKMPEGKILINYRITDAMFAEIIARPERYEVIVTTNLNGDYLSDAIAALVGGLGIAPGANIGEFYSIFEATHGTAPDIAGKNKANPSSLLLSAVMMLEHIGWSEAAKLVVEALQSTINQRVLTGDMTRLMKRATTVGTAEFAAAIIANLGKGIVPPSLTWRERFAASLRRLADRIEG